MALKRREICVLLSERRRRRKKYKDIHSHLPSRCDDGSLRLIPCQCVIETSDVKRMRTREIEEEEAGVPPRLNSFS